MLCSPREECTARRVGQARLRAGLVLLMLPGGLSSPGPTLSDAEQRAAEQVPPLLPALSSPYRDRLPSPHPPPSILVMRRDGESHNYSDIIKHLRLDTHNLLTSSVTLPVPGSNVVLEPGRGIKLWPLAPTEETLQYAMKQGSIRCLHSRLLIIMGADRLSLASQAREQASSSQTARVTVTADRTQDRLPPLKTTATRDSLSVTLLRRCLEIGKEIGSEEPGGE
ncbi:unnamed protein product [Pleuronectes platessa]|uniref:Uncharacterized protein n=1 Tax=Pleuronectes platessa TaxID=8262 RepID=A0A9N7U7F5_PLEPL|nr:unnamed protein product [Pleuronectes platessa]